MGKTDEGPSATETELDRVFKAAEQLNPKAKCHSSYKTFHLAPPKTANSILISMAVDLDPFSIDAVRSMTSTSYLCNYDKNGFIKNYVFAKNPKTGVKEPIRASDNLDLRTIGDEKTALFINIPQTNSAYNFLISLMYSQLFDELYSRAEHVSPNRFHIYDKYGQVISSQYETEEAAKRAIYLYSTAEVREYEGHYYIYNPNATPKETLPEMNLKTSKKQSFTGYMREVYSVEVGEALIARYQTSGKHNEPEYVEPVEEEPIEEEVLESEIQETEEDDDDTTVIEINLDTVKNLFGKAKGITNKIPQPKISAKPKAHKSFSGQVSDGPVIKRGALRLPIHVRFLLDEFANSTTRSATKTVPVTDKIAA